MIDLRRIFMRVMTPDEFERLKHEKLPFDDLLEEIRPMERIYLAELKDIIEEFEDIVTRIWGNGFYVMDMRHDLDEFENEMSLQEQWDDFKAELSYISDRYHPQRIARVTSRLAIIHRELRFLEEYSHEDRVDIFGSEEKATEFENRMRYGKVKE